MQTKPTLDLSAAAVRQSTDLEPAQARPVELDLNTLQCVAGGAPRGGWSAATTTDTTDAPRGGW